MSTIRGREAGFKRIAERGLYLMKFLPIEGSTEGIWKIGVDNLDWVDNSNTCGCSFVIMPARLLGMKYPLEKLKVIL